MNPDAFDLNAMSFGPLGVDTAISAINELKDSITTAHGLIIE
jgi:hypothetical protein